MKILSLFLTLIQFTSFAKGEFIVVYSDENQRGEEEVVKISECSNLSARMADKTTSVNTTDNCARFYDGCYCTGNSIEVMPRSPSHNYLGDWNFDNKARSVGPCRDACNSTITENSPEKVGEPVEITLFNRIDFKGAYQTIAVSGCTLIPTKFIYQLLSVSTNSTCIQLYNNIKCKHEGEGVDSIELRQGTPHHDDMSRWWVPEARAVSHCNYKCNRSKDENLSTDEIIPKEGEVVLFDAENFEGNFIVLAVSNCVNLTDQWEGAVASLKTYNNEICISLFNRQGCEGSSLNVTSSRSLSEDLTRSMKPCNLIRTDSIPHKDLVVIVAVPILVVIICILLAILIMRRCHTRKEIADMLTEKEIQEFLYGPEQGSEQIFNDNTETRNHEGEDFSIEKLAQNKPYNETFEVLRSNIEFDAKKPLGMGEFGVVYKGTLMIPHQETVDAGSSTSKVAKNINVAIKTVRPNAHIQCLRSLLKEIKVMLYVGRHTNVVQLVGCCTENLRTKGEILVLVNFCSNGSLEGFLQKNRLNFSNIVTKGKIDANEFQKQSSAAALARIGQYYQHCTKRSAYNIFQLLQWIIEIACGMEFIASKKIIHSDLAARNILLDEKFVAKISDFGLSKQLYCYTEYLRKGQEPLPWRWLALESLKDMEFSTKSDVWSYGILSWEIFTLGEKPYPGVVWSNDFIRNLEDGLRLRKPRYATADCYNLMMRCWDENPKYRPDFTEIREELENILDSATADSLSVRPNSEFLM